MEKKDIKDNFIDLSNLEKSKNKKMILWKKSIGRCIKFRYNKICGEFKILDVYPGCIIKLSYLGKEYEIFSSSIIGCNLGFITGDRKKHDNITYNVDDVIDRKFGKIKIIEKINETNYKYICLRDGYISEITKHKLMKGTGCKECYNKNVNRRIKKNIIDYKNIYNLIENGEDSLDFYKCKNNDYFYFVCPICQTKIKRKLVYVKNRGFNCPACSDNRSRGEKFIYNILKQVGSNFVIEKSFKWSNKRRYDFFIKDLNTIIEVHGSQHYEDNSFNNYNVSKTKNNDQYKKNIAIENGVDNYIELNFKNYDLYELKENLLKSKLKNMYDLNDIDYNVAFLESESNIFVDICNSYNNDVSIEEICNSFNISRDSALYYLRRGNKLGICNYKFNYNRRKIICLNNGEIFESIKCCANNFNTTVSVIIHICKKETNGLKLNGEVFKFEYYEGDKNGSN